MSDNYGVGFETPQKISSIHSLLFVSTTVPSDRSSTKVITHSYFFSFFVSGQAASVNDVQGIRLHKPTKIKLGGY